MTLLSDPHVSRLFMESNIESHRRDADVGLLQEALEALGLQPSDVMAVSRGEYSLYVVCTSLIAVAGTKGIFRKQLALKGSTSLDEVSELRISEEGYKDKREYILALVSQTPGSSVRLTWIGWLGEFGGTPAANAQTERDRIYQLVKAAARL